MKKAICVVLIMVMTLCLSGCAEETPKELTLADKIVIATFQGAIRDVADKDADKYEKFLNSVTISDVGVKQYKKSEASPELLGIIADEPYGDVIIKDEQTWIVYASFSYVNENNTLIEVENEYGSVGRDGSASFGKGIEYSTFGETTLYLLYENVYNMISKNEELNIDLIKANLSDETISIEVQQYLRDLE